MNFQEIPAFIREKKNYFLLALPIFLILVSFVLIQVLKIRNEGIIKEKVLSQKPVPTVQAYPKPELPHKAPQVFFDTYEKQAENPIIPVNIKSYTLKTYYTNEETLEIGRKFGLDQYKEKDNYITMYNLTDMNNRGILSFRKDTGAFVFQSFGSHKAPKYESKTEQVRSFLLNNGLIDNTVSCPITYQVKGASGTNVECHRDWTNTSLPILNTIGIMNVPENKRLSALLIGTTDLNSSPNPNIINTSTGEDGKSRPNDFNTITVKISDDGNILSIESNLRPVKLSSNIQKGELLSPDEAYSQFAAHQSQFSLTNPVGETQKKLNWEKVYPENKASGQKAIITDYILTYLENPASLVQNYLVPMYLIRGYSTLATGYKVAFEETVPALKNNLSMFSPEEEGMVAGITYPSGYPSDNPKSLQLYSFDPTVSITLTPTIIVPSNTPVPTTPVSTQPPLPHNTTAPHPTSPPQPTSPPIPTQASTPDKCATLSTTWEYTVNIPNIGTMTVAVLPGDLVDNPNTIYLKSASFNYGWIQEIRDYFFSFVVEDQYLINISKWLKDNQDNLSIFPNQKMPSTKTEAQDLFTVINNNNSLGNIAPVPEYNSGGFRLAQEQMAVYNNVANKLVSDIILGNTIDTWAAKANIFPLENRSNLEALFYAPDRMPYCGMEYLTGSSPYLFLYPSSPMEISIKPYFNLLNPYPHPDSDGSWTFNVNPDGTMYLKKGMKTAFPYLYYEHDRKLNFDRQYTGWVTNKNGWNNLLADISYKLGLNSKEKGALIADFKATVEKIKVDHSYLFISLVDREEIDQKLPLSINPAPDSFTRIHLFIIPLSEKFPVNPPVMTPIKRAGFTALEIGAYLEKK
jgi:hypothetical protein